MTFDKILAGWYASPDGTYAVVRDGYEKSASVGAEVSTGYEGFQGGEWAAVYDPQGRLREDSGAGDNLDWYPKMADAVIGAMEHHQAHKVRS